MLRSRSFISPLQIQNSVKIEHGQMQVPKGERLTDEQIKELSMNIQLDIVPPQSNATE